MSKVVKDMQIAEIRNRLGDARDMVVIDSSRLDAIRTNKLRIEMRRSNIRALTVKNALAKQAFRQAGLPEVQSLEGGQSTLIWGSEDIVALAKQVAKWAKDLEQLTIKGGVVEGTPATAEQIDSLSKSPGRLELIGQIAGLVLSPGRQLGAAILGPGGRISGQLKALADKEEQAA